MPARSRKGAIATIAVLVLVVVAPLAAISKALTQADVHNVVDPWAKAAGWTVVSINPAPDGITVRATGPLPEPSTTGLRAGFDAHGLAHTTVHRELVPGTVIDLKGH